LLILRFIIRESGLFGASGLSFGAAPSSEVSKDVPAKTVNSSIAGILGAAPTSNLVITSVASVAPSSISLGTPKTLSVAAIPASSSPNPGAVAVVTNPVSSAKGLTSKE